MVALRSLACAVIVLFALLSEVCVNLQSFVSANFEDIYITSSWHKLRKTPWEAAPQISRCKVSSAYIR